MINDFMMIETNESTRLFVCLVFNLNCSNMFPRPSNYYKVSAQPVGTNQSECRIMGSLCNPVIAGSTVLLRMVKCVYLIIFYAHVEGKKGEN